MKLQSEQARSSGHSRRPAVQVLGFAPSAPHPLVTSSIAFLTRGQIRRMNDIQWPDAILIRALWQIIRSAIPIFKTH